MSNQKLICIDPGHGGSDPGAVRKQGGHVILAEKDVVCNPDPHYLGIAERLGHHLRKAGFRTVMTRESDTFISLDDRVAGAKQNKADMFISLHCNAATNPLATGIEAWTYKSTASRVQLAKSILAELLKQPEAKGMKNRGVKQANFAVLRGVDALMPAVLLEVGFISNAGDATRLASVYYREAVAKAISAAVVRYYEK